MAEENPEPTAALPPPEVVEPSAVQIAYSDWMVTIGADRGIVSIDFGALDYSLCTGPDSPPRVFITSRLRMGEDFARRLHGVLGQILGVSSQDGPDPLQKVSATNSLLN